MVLRAYIEGSLKAWNTENAPNEARAALMRLQDRIDLFESEYHSKDDCRNFWKLQTESLRKRFEQIHAADEEQDGR